MSSPFDKQLLDAAGATSENVAGVTEALRQGADVNTKDQYNNTALNTAALWGHGEIVKKLIEAGADLENKGSGGGLTPLANAASRGHMEVARILLDRGARVTDDLLSVLQTKVNIFEENYEIGQVTQEGLAHWKNVLELFVTQRLKQDLPDVIPHLSSAGPERTNAVARVAEAASRGLEVTDAAVPLTALLADADPDTRGHAGRGLAYHLARTGGWAQVCEILGSSHTEVRAAAAEALIRTPADDSLLEPLRGLLHDASADVRKTAALTVSTLPNKGVDARLLVPRMTELLRDADPAVRRSAAFAFRSWSKQGLREYCSPALAELRSVAEHDESEPVRQFAGHAIALAEGWD